MFTGIVTELGTVRKARRRARSVVLEVECAAIARSLGRGDSVAVSGVCLTATETGRRRFSAEVTDETLSCTTLRSLGRGAAVNLELPLRPIDRLGGHIVQGHVDGVASVSRVEEDGLARRTWIAAADDLLRYLAPKGSVALDGVSLTVVDVGVTTFQVALIPHTLAATTLGRVEPGTEVNVEVDVLAKYVERFLERKDRDAVRGH